MDTKTLHITGEHAIKLMRAARIGEVVLASPSPTREVALPPGGIATLRGLGIDELIAWLRIAPDNPLKMLTPRQDRRFFSQEVRSSLLSGKVPQNAFLQLEPGRDRSSAIALPENIRILIDSPQLAFIRQACALEPLLAAGGNATLVISLRLIEFACECCGAYVRDPFEPRVTIAHYDKPGTDTRFCNLSDMQAFVEEADGMAGRKRAMKLLQYAADALGSAMESYLYLALSGPPKLGGLSICEPLVNKQLVVDSKIQPLLKHGAIRPDFQWPDFKTLVEFMGDEEHASKSARIEDKNRFQDYAIAGYEAFSLMFDDVRNVAALNRTAEMIARSLMQHGKRNELYRLRRLLKDDNFRARQTLLVAKLLPPVTRYVS